MALYHRLSMLLQIMLKQSNQNTAVRFCIATQYRINIILIKIYNNTNNISEFNKKRYISSSN